MGCAVGLSAIAKHCAGLPAIRFLSFLDLAVVVKTNGIPFLGICAPPILELILAGIGMFTGGTI